MPFQTPVRVYNAALHVLNQNDTASEPVVIGPDTVRVNGTIRASYLD